MQENSSNLKYTESHEWLRIDSDGTITVGITDHAQEALGDIVFVELPEVGKKLSAQESCAVIESVKAASDVYSPSSGEVIEINNAVVDSPDSINKDAFSAWLFKIKPSEALDESQFMQAEQYNQHIA